MEILASKMKMPHFTQKAATFNLDWKVVTVDDQEKGSRFEKSRLQRVWIRFKGGNRLNDERDQKACIYLIFMFHADGSGTLFCINV